MRLSAKAAKKAWLPTPKARVPVERDRKLDRVKSFALKTPCNLMSKKVCCGTRRLDEGPLPDDFGSGQICLPGDAAAASRTVDGKLAI